MDHGSGMVSITLAFTLPGNSIDNDTEIELSSDFSTMHVDLKPHGLTFKTPGCLSYSVRGINGKKISSDGTPKSFYCDEEKQMMEEMQAGSVTIDDATGVISCVDGVIPQFSRYALCFIKQRTVVRTK